METPLAPRTTERIHGKMMYDYRIIDASDIDGYENAVMDLTKRKYDGILVRNAIPAEICDLIIANGRKAPEAEKAQMPVGWSFPPIFAALVGQAFKQGEEVGRKIMADYFMRCADYRTHSKDYFGVDTTEIVESWLAKFGGGCEIDVPYAPEHKGLYAGSTLRAYKGNGEGNISIHCGNYFQTCWQKFYEQLETHVDVMDQLSFFFMLQQPEHGGELSLYDLIWENGQTKKTNHENKEVILADGSIRNIENDQVQYIDPQKGDMILFAAGQIWHRVEAVLGSLERITLGGFLAYSYDKKKIYYWS